MLPGTIEAAAAAVGDFPESLVVQADDAHPKPDARLTYGTAGFRAKADLLDSTCLRIGMMAALRSKALAGQTVGVMVTASHNPEADNGVKMVDPRGEMLDAAWEPLCTQVANAPSSIALVHALRELVEQGGVDMQMPARVVYAHDTRPSCPALVRAIAEGLAVMGAESRDAGLLTTPQLHYLVRAQNTVNSPRPFGEPSVEGYYRKLAAAYAELTADAPAPPALVVDCANGVGAKALKELLSYLPETLTVRTLRTDINGRGVLNAGCGADFVKSQQRLPLGYEGEVAVQAGGLLCSLDGDADRIVFYYLDGPAERRESFHLLDGDKIASLAADYLSELVRQSGLQDVSLGCVQTAYANGAAARYLEQRVPVTCTPTGVKHLHHAAERYDIGVYFEANGHGTVLFSERMLQAIDQEARSPSSPAAARALAQLRAFSELINQTVGDALSDMLLVLVVLAARHWGPRDWAATYTELPNRLLKVNVADRTQFHTTDAERRLTAPAGLQDRIDALVGKYSQGRSFVRPSGTEDCVRVYAEAGLGHEADLLAQGVAKLVAESGA